MQLRVERREASAWISILIPLLAIGITLILVAGLVWLSGAGLWETYYYFFIKPLSSRASVIEVLVKATPLLFTGAAVAFAFYSGYWNIGAEGQLYAGAAAAAWLGVVLKGLPPVVIIPLIMLGSALAAALWALPPAWLKTRLNVDEVVTTLLLNSVMIFFVSSLLNGPWRDPVTNWPQSPTLEAASRLPRLLAGTRLHLGFLLAIVALIFFWWITARASFGLRMRAVGRGREAARFMGVHVNQVVFRVALISGAVAGLAGASEVAGLHYHLIEALSPGYGYSGIVAATLGSLHPIGVALAAIFIGLISTGSQTASRALGVPSFLGDVVQAVLLLVTLALLLLRTYRVRMI
ncbi:MAG: ABC transporter permease [Chloroflexi bacterium]|nr:ABC transporter permease [Chloroflexota bacterium]